MQNPTAYVIISVSGGTAHLTGPLRLQVYSLHVSDYSSGAFSTRYFGYFDSQLTRC
jgi:hypothetical protein